MKETATSENIPRTSMPIRIEGFNFCPFLNTQTTDNATTDLTITPRPEASTKAMVRSGKARIHVRR